MTISKERHIALGVVLCALICVIANAYTTNGSSELEGLTGSQDVRSLDRRVSSLEQRLYSIESSINRLEQSARSQRTPASQPGARDPEINLLPGEVSALQQRLSDVECGLVKLDERTTPGRQAGTSTGAKNTDPCRLDPATPLRLPTRP